MDKQKYKLILSAAKQNYADNGILFLDFYKYFENHDFLKYLRSDSLSHLYPNIFKDSISSDKNIALRILLAIKSFQYYEGNFWNIVRDKAKYLYDFGMSIEEVESSIKNAIDDRDIYGDTRYITSPLVHSFVPLPFLNKFFDFVYDIYHINFDNNIDEYFFDEILRHTMEAIKLQLEKDKYEDDFIEFVTSNKTYNLIKSTKRAFIYHENSSMEALKYYLLLIDNWFFKKELLKSKYSNKVIEIFKDWVEGKKGPGPNGPIAPRVSSPAFIFNTNNNKIFLEIPEIFLHVKEILDYTKLSVYLNEDGTLKKLSLNNDYKIVNRIGYYTIKIYSSAALIDNPFNDIKIEAHYDGEVIYDSGTRLRRDYLLFNVEGKEIKNNRVHDGTVFLVYKKEDVFDEMLIYEGNYNVSVFDADSTKVYTLGEHLILFADKVEVGIQGAVLPKTKVYCNGQQIKGFKDIYYLTLSLDYEIKSFKLFINERLHEFSHEDFSMTKGTKNRYMLKLNNELFSRGYYDLKMIINDFPKEPFDKFIFDPNYELTTDHSYNSNEVYVNLNSSFPNIKDSHKFDLINNDSMDIHFSLGHDNFKYRIDPIVKRWRWKDSKKWSRQAEIILRNETLIFDFPGGIINVSITDDTKRIELFRLLEYKITNDLFELNLETLFQFKNMYDVINLKIEGEDNTSWYSVYLNTVVISHSAFFNKAGDFVITFNTKNFIPDSLKFSMPVEGFIHNTVLKKESIKVPTVKGFKDYYFEVSKKIGTPFSKPENNVIYRKHIFPINAFGLSGRYFDLRRATIHRNINGKDQFVEVEINNTVLQFLKLIKNEAELPEYSSLDFRERIVYRAQLHKIRGGSLRAFSFVKFVYVEFTNEHSQYFTANIIDEDGDSLCYNTNYKFIYDDMYPNVNNDIAEIKINLKEGIWR